MRAPLPVAVLALAWTSCALALTPTPPPAQPLAQDAPPVTTSRPVRAPRPPPAVPPERAAKPIAAVALVNPGFESTQPGMVGAPEGWWAVQHAGPLSYTFEPDTRIRRGGERSLKVANVGPEPFGAIYQTIAARPYRGQWLRVSAWLRTEETNGNRFGSGAGLKLHSARGGYPLDVAEMRRDAVHGTTDWTRYEIALKVPPEAEQIEAGLVLFGPGTVWLDDVALDVIAEPPPTARTENHPPAQRTR